MATPSQPSQPSGPSNQPSNINAKDLARSLKDLLEDQGDYNNLLKNALSDLKKMDNAYLKIEARLASLSKDTINVKQTNQELLKLKQKEYLEGKKLRDLEKEFSQDTKDQLENAKRIAEAQKARLTAQGRSFDVEKAMMGILKSKGNIEAVALYAAEKQLELARKETLEGEKALATEKLVSKQLGISGGLMKGFADKLGVGEDAYNAMTLAARQTVDETGKVTTPGKWKVFKAGISATKSAIIQNLKDPMVQVSLAIGAIVGTYKLLGKGFDAVGAGAKKAMSTIGAEEGPITKIAGTFSGMLKNIPMIGGLLAGVVDSFAMLLDFAVKAKSEIQEMGRQIGLSAQESLDLSNHYHNFAVASGKAYLNNKALLKTQIDMNKELGITNKISDANVQTAFELMKFAGVELDTVTKIEQISKITGKNQSNIAGAVMHQVNNFKKLTGVGFSFQGILKEVANLSGYLGLKLAKYPGEIIKSVVAAKGLGLELKQLDSMADGFLDVESSIQKEMEAQVLTGRDINLNRARELFLNNQLVEAGEELSKQLGTSEDFLKMNRYEANAFAEAMGMSRDQVADMLKQQEYMAAFGAGSVKELQKKVALMKEQGRAQEAINKLGSEESFNKLVAASATEDLSGFIEKIKESFAALVSNTKLADMVQNFIQFLSKPDNIVKLLNRIKDVFGTIVSVIGSVMGGIMRAVNVIVGWFSDFQIDEGMISMVEGAGANIKSFDMGNLVSSAPSIGDNAVRAQTAGASAAAAPAASQGFGGAKSITVNSIVQLENRTLAVGTAKAEEERTKADGQRIISPNGTGK